jgi:hypothetical protein
MGIPALTHNLVFTGIGALATAKVPSRRTTLVKNRYPMQIPRFATGTFGQKEFLFSLFQHFYLEFLL